VQGGGLEGGRREGIHVRALIGLVERRCRQKGTELGGGGRKEREVCKKTSGLFGLHRGEDNMRCRRRVAEGKALKKESEET